MIQLDQRIDEARIRKFASQVAELQPHVRHVFDEMILKEEGPEFYHGQLAALQFAHQLAEGTQAQSVMGAAIAVISKHIVDKGWW